MKTAAAVKNDTFEDDICEAFNDIHSAVHDLRMVGWVMNCMADPAETPPEGIYRTDLGFFLAKLVKGPTDQISDKASAALERLHQRRQASR